MGLPVVPPAAVPSVVAAVTVVAAARSTWSPCGWSVLSTITPIAERRRGHRYSCTAAWYVAGALLGGLSLGSVSAVLAVGVRTSGLPSSARAAALGVVLLVVAASDSPTVRGSLPGHRRQVNEDWLDLYRPWVYGIGYGWQIGVGLATYIRTAAVYAVVVGAATSASPAFALAVGAGFGLLRGLAVYLTAGCSNAEQLLAFHRRFAAADAPSVVVTTGTVAAGGAIVAGAAALPLGIAFGGAAFALIMRAVPRGEATGAAVTLPEVGPSVPVG
jgi:hypothetical protein